MLEMINSVIQSYRRTPLILQRGYIRWTPRLAWRYVIKFFGGWFEIVPSLFNTDNYFYGSGSKKLCSPEVSRQDLFDFVRWLIGPVIICPTRCFYDNFWWPGHLLSRSSCECLSVRHKILQMFFSEKYQVWRACPRRPKPRDGLAITELASLFYKNLVLDCFFVQSYGLSAG